MLFSNCIALNGSSLLTKVQDETIHKLLEIARNVGNKREELYQEYILWDKSTSKTIETLQKIRDKLNNHSFNSKCAILSGTSATILGSIAGIAGVALAVPTAGLSLALTVGGTGLATTGGILSAGSSITNHFLSKQLCKEAKEVLELNIKYVEKIEQIRHDYFHFLKEFENLLNQLEEKDYQILSILTEENLEDTLKDVHLDNAVHSSLPPTVSKMEEMKQNGNILAKNLILIKYFRELIELIRKDPNMKRLIELIRKDPNMKRLLYKFLPDTVRELINPLSVLTGAATSVTSKIESGIVAGKGIAETSKNFQFVVKEMGKTVRIGIGVLNAVFLVWGMVDLVTTSIQVHRRTESDQSKEIGEIAINLQNYRQEMRAIVREKFEWDLNYENDLDDENSLSNRI